MRSSTSQRSRSVPVAIFLVGAAGLLASTFFVDRSMRASARERAGAELDAVALLKVDSIGDYREALERTADFLGDSAHLRAGAAAALDDGPGRAEVLALARDRLAREARRQGLARMALVDAAGRVLVEYGEPGLPAADLDGGLVAEALASTRPAVSRLRAEQAEGRPWLDVVAPLHVAAGQAPAAVYLRHDLTAFLEDLAGSWPVPNRTAETVLIRRDGDAALFLTEPRRLTGWRMHARAPLTESKRGLVRAVLGERGVIQALDFQGVPILMSIRPVAGSDWLLLTRFDVAEIEAPVARTVGVVAGGLTLLLLASAAGLALWYRREDRQHQALAAAARALEEGEARLRLALAGTAFVWEWDLEAGRLSGDPKWMEAMGAPPGGVKGAVEDVLRALVSEQDLEEVLAKFQSHLRGEAPLFEAEFRGQDATGEVRWISIRGRVYERDRSGQPRRAMGVVSDVTALRRVQEELERSERLLSLGTLAAGVAHEINNPLTYVLDATGRLADELPGALPSRPDLAEAAGHARDGAERVREVVRRLRAFSRPGAERRGPVDVAGEVAVAVRLAGHELRHRTRVEVRAGPAPLVVASPHQLGQVFLNLLLNAAAAVEAAAPPARLVEVVVGTDAAGWACVEVRDNGTGIPPSVLPHIFEPFFTTRAQESGTGLGLAIAWAEVAAAGGRLEVESEEGKGSTFRVLLPPAPRAPGRAPSAPAPSRSPAAPSPAPTSPSPGRTRVLVVDDDPLVARAVARAVGRDHEVVMAAGGAEALERIGAQRFDAVVCDLMMPGMTGMELHRRVAAADPGLAARFLFVTGGAFTEEARAFLEGSAAPRVEKPFEPAQLRAAVDAVVRGAAAAGA